MGQAMLPALLSQPWLQQGRRDQRVIRCDTRVTRCDIKAEAGMPTHNDIEKLSVPLTTAKSQSPPISSPK
jgi:hypothetical protein